jgi:hypothetical protein
VHRVISYITLIQAGVVVGGTLWVVVWCKVNGYGSWAPDGDFNAAALFIRRSGWVLLLFPACWAAAALVLVRLDTHPWLLRGIIALGLAAILFGFFAYIEIGVSPRGLSMHAGAWLDQLLPQHPRKERAAEILAFGILKPAVQLRAPRG